MAYRVLGDDGQLSYSDMFSSAVGEHVFLSNANIATMRCSISPFVPKELKKMKKTLQIVAPVGELPSTDIELRERIKTLKVESLPVNAGLAKVFAEVGIWEKSAVRKFREQEKTKLSGKLTIC